MNTSLTTAELTRIFLVLVVLLFSAHTLGYLFQRIRLPRVVGEIGGGLLLGPTVLGFFAPDAHRWLFAAFEAESRLISLFYWFGLVLLMFTSGFDLQKSLDRDDKRTIIGLTLGSTIIPFAVGWLAPYFFDFSPYLGEKKNVLALQIIIAIATAVTSIPVLTKIFIDLNIIRTRFAKIVLSTATIHDVILWVALAVATGLVGAGSSSVSSILSHLLLTALFFGVALLVIPKTLNVLNQSDWNHLMRSSVVGYMLFICFLFAAVASYLSVNVVFGAMLGGVVIGMSPGQFVKEKVHIKEVSLAFFVPLYFAIVGLKLDLVRHFDPWFFVWFFLITTAAQMLGTMAAARILGKDTLSSFNFGVAMSDRGGPAIVLATVAFEVGIINETFFVSLVLIAVITSLMAGMWFRFILMKGYPLLKEEEIESDLSEESATVNLDAPVATDQPGSERARVKSAG